MTARLGPVQQPEEPVFAQLKPVLGAREAAIFPGEDLKQQQQPPPPQQQQHPGGGGANLPAEEMVQVGSEQRSQRSQPPVGTRCCPRSPGAAPRPGRSGRSGAGGTGWGRAAGRGRRTPNCGAVAAAAECVCVCMCMGSCVCAGERPRRPSRPCGAGALPWSRRRSAARRPGPSRRGGGSRAAPASVLKATAAAFALARRQN